MNTEDINKALKELYKDKEYKKQIINSNPPHLINKIYNEKL